MQTFPLFYNRLGFFKAARQSYYIDPDPAGRLELNSQHESVNEREQSCTVLLACELNGFYAYHSYRVPTRRTIERSHLILAFKAVHSSTLE